MLTDRELQGLGYERQIYQAIEDNDLNQYMTFCNPLWNEHSWKVERGKGRDFELKFPNGKVAQIEGKFSNSDYEYRKSWYWKSVVPRFTDPDATQIVVSNRPSNLTKPRAAPFILGNIVVVTIDGLISLLLSLLHTPLPLRTNYELLQTTNLYNIHHTTIQLDSHLLSSNPLIRLLQTAYWDVKREESLFEYGCS